MGSIFEGADIVSVYTREDALEDGVLVAVPTNMARQAGILYPVAMTRAVWDRYVAVDDAAKDEGQSVNGRLWDVLWMFRSRARSADGDCVTFSLYVAIPGSVPMQPNEQPPEAGTGFSKERHRLVELRGIVGPGDDFEPVITIMLPNED